jgi:hypothetical protein
MKVTRAKLRQHGCLVRAALTLGISVLTPNIARATGDAGLVPISWALDVRNGKASNVAVAVPWSLDYARLPLRQAPPLLRFFPHVSLLGSGDAKSATLNNNPHFTMGCGVGLAGALALGVGVQLDNPFAHAYIMAGLSLTDIVQFVL